MDPVSAFSLACGVIQVVDFSTRVIASFRELRKNGSLAGNEEIEDMATRLESLRTNLELPASNSNKDLNIDDKSLLDLADNCSEIAKNLIKIVRTFKLDGSYSMRQALKKSLKALWKKGDVNEIQERLDRYQKVLDTKILINLRKRIDLAAVRQTEEFRNLDGNYQSILIRLATEQRSSRELRDMIQAGTTSTKDHVTHLFQHQRKELEIQGYRQRILESLWFADIHARHETIHEAHKSTFQWIFNDPTRQSRAGHDFVQWLERGDGTYWISGKAGSGKSTLMHYICEHPQLNTHLKIWSASKPILSPTFFFWRAGSALQQSSAGLLRSLLYQILQAYPEMIISTAQTESSSGVIDSSSEQSRLIPAWTETRLQRKFQNTLSTIAKSHHVCFFIDGLDEISGNQDNLVALIERTIQNANIKVCLSSRPYRVFEDAFGSTMKLGLQDLTEEDIQTYVLDKVYATDRARSLAIEQPMQFFSLIQALVYNARGVFLWVQLAVKDQIEGLKNGDSLEQLQERLRLLPTEIEDLYVNMLDRIDKMYRREAAQCFKIMTQAPAIGSEYDNFSMLDSALASFSLLDLALTIFEGLDDFILSSSSEIDLCEIIDLCNTRRKRIAITCAGLLEVQRRSYRRPGIEDDGFNMHRRNCDPLDDSDANPNTNFVGRSPFSETSHDNRKVMLNAATIKVDLVHRTVIDFFQEHPRAKDFMVKNCPPEFNSYAISVKVFFAKLRIFGFRNPPQYTIKDWNPRDPRDMMRTMLELEMITGTAHVDLGNLFNDLMTQLDLEIVQGPQQGHWTGRYSRSLEDEYLWWPVAFWSTSQSSSVTNRSSYSTMSAPANTDASAMMLERAVGFLGFAAQSGLILYVQEVLESRPEWLDSPMATYLLRCVMAFVQIFLRSWKVARVEGFLYAKFFEFMAMLVRQGGKPNAPLFCKTIWIIFLEQMWWAKTRYRLISRKEKPIVFESAWAIAATVFLGHGADVHEIIEIEEMPLYAMREQPEIRNAISGALPDSVDMKLQLSTFSVLESCLEDVSGWAQIRELCDAKGAQSYSRCTSLSFGFNDETSYEHSQERLDHFCELYVQHHRPFWNSDPVDIRLELARFIERSYNDAECDSYSISDFDNHEWSNEASQMPENDG